MKKAFGLVLACFIMMALLSGGCGGGGGGSKSNNNNTPSPDPGLDDDTEIIINVLDGSWVGSNGNSTATGYGGTFTLNMTKVSAQFSDTKLNGNSAKTRVTSSARWDVYQNGNYIRTIPLDYTNETVTAERIGLNEWRYTFPSSESRITILLISETTAEVIEEGSFGIDGYNYQYSATYIMTKVQEPEQEQGDEEQQTGNGEFALTILDGSWVGSNGRGTATGYGETFTLTMTRASADFFDTQLGDNTANTNVTFEAEWEAYNNGNYIQNIPLYYAEDKAISIERIGVNTWRYKFSDNERRMTVVFTSATTAEVTEEGMFSDLYNYGDYSFQYKATYTMTKVKNLETNSDDISFKVLNGSWKASNGNGTATARYNYNDEGVKYELSMMGYASISFSDIKFKGNTADARVTYSLDWNVYQNGNYIRTISLGYKDETITAERIGINNWRFSRGEKRITILFTSATTAEVTEEDSNLEFSGYIYQINAAYTMTKE